MYYSLIPIYVKCLTNKGQTAILNLELERQCVAVRNCHQILQKRNEICQFALPIIVPPAHVPGDSCILYLPHIVGGKGMMTEGPHHPPPPFTIDETRGEYAAANHSFLPQIRCCQWGYAAAPSANPVHPCSISTRPQNPKWSMVNSQRSMVNEKEGGTRPQTIPSFLKFVVVNGGTRPHHPPILFIRVRKTQG